MHILIRLSGDVSIKAKNTRKRFVREMIANLRDALESHGVDFRIERTWSRLTVETDDERAAEICSRVFGVQSVSPVERRNWNDLGDLVAQATEFFEPEVRDRTFAVRARRGGPAVEEIPFNSGDVEVDLGTALLATARKVDLSQPEVTASVEIRRSHADLFTEQIDGPGGLPLGVEGRALALVSGGFDSAVAAWLMLKRGVALDYLFFNLGGLAHEVGVLEVMKVIADRWSYGSRPQLFAVDLRPSVEALQAAVTPRYWQVVLKRLMMEAGSRVAAEEDHCFLVTGEAVGQVSSQTLPNLAVVSHAATTPVLRPLAGFNKEDIVALARRIGTFELSAAVGEYCAILPRHPATHSDVETIEEEERGLDREPLARAVESRRTIDLRALDRSRIGAEQLEIDEIPASATVIDLRSRAAYETWHYPDALFMEYSQALRAYPSFRKDTPYVLYCEVGLKSAHLAELMQEAGFEAHHVRGGVRQLERWAAAPA
ncbi:MAG: tRNA uracil 4-sulfurtransferase ThiI [Thermoanaerobaculia bacterium]|nr:tRNA uracil 4-sulfurtransferase ThiI [Thermoanaerobaculia bacterium]